MSNYKEIAGTKKYFKYRECEVGDVLVEGVFLHELQGRYGVQYEFEDKSGDIHVLNGSGQLQYKMDFVKEGDKIKVIYDGEIDLTKGPMAGKTAHQFKLLRAMDDSDLDAAEEEDTGLDSFGDL